MKYNSYKCPNCGSNMVIHKLNKTGKCEYCGHEVIYDIPDDELSRLIESANAHLKLNDQRVLRRDCNLLYERYPGNPVTYYYLAKADLMEVKQLINNKEAISRCSYLLSNAFLNLCRLKEFNTDNDFDPSDVVSEYNHYVTINNKDLAKLIRKIRIHNFCLFFGVSVFVILVIVLAMSSLLFLGILLIIFGLLDHWPRKIAKKYKNPPKKVFNPIFH